MKIVSTVTTPKIVEATTKANAILQNQSFYDRIAEHPAFDPLYTDTTPAIIAGLIKTTDLTFNVVTFTPKWYQYFYYFKTDAYQDPKVANTLFLNTDKLDNYDSDYWASTIIHESIHALDAVSDYKFDHGDNERKGKENTAPYWIGSLVLLILEGN